VNLDRKQSWTLASLPWPIPPPNVEATRFLELGAIGPSAAAEPSIGSQARSPVVGDRRDVAEPTGILDHSPSPSTLLRSARRTTSMPGVREGSENVALRYGVLTGQ
jgi:hypothetical protein